MQVIIFLSFLFGMVYSRSMIEAGFSGIVFVLIALLSRLICLPVDELNFLLTMLIVSEFSFSLLLACNAIMCRFVMQPIEK